MGNIYFCMTEKKNIWEADIELSSKSFGANEDMYVVTPLKGQQVEGWLLTHWQICEPVWRYVKLGNS